MNGADTMETRAREAMRRAMEHAAALGVDLVVEWQDHVEPGRVTFHVERRTGPPGSGELAVRRLLELVDPTGAEVSIDVLDSIPALFPYYWRMGFRLHDGTPDGERTCLGEIEAEREAFYAVPRGEGEDFGVTTMWRTPGAGALAPVA